MFMTCNNQYNLGQTTAAYILGVLDVVIELKRPRLNQAGCCLPLARLTSFITAAHHITSLNWPLNAICQTDRHKQESQASLLLLISLNRPLNAIEVQG